jgi:sulfatase maturation enzyme AslB (radical SAM superfamily)
MLNDAPKQQFTLEITTTALCNMACTYCFEGLKTNKTVLTDIKTEVLKGRVNEILGAEWFLEKYNSLNISFWGGEPTLNGDLIIDMMNTFEENDMVDFHIYTNALDRKKLDYVLDNVDTGQLRMQVSWDGDVINKAYRIQGTNTDTTERVLGNMKYLIDRGINVSMKATVPIECMSDIESSWDSYKTLFDTMGGHHAVTYAPTIDYVNELPEKELGESISMFRKSMISVAKKELAFYKKHGQFLCAWFNGSEQKVHCASGSNMVAVDVSGKTYACHGSLYSPNKEEMGSGSIMDMGWVENLGRETKKYADAIRTVPSTCVGCVATTCMICPVVSLDNSENDKYMDRWTDRYINNMCGYFKTFGEIDRAVVHQVKTFSN